jgi:hypothetical protein
VPVLIYSLLRLALFVVATVALAFAGMGWLFAVIVGAVLAALLSYLLLNGPRDRAAQWMQARADRRGDRPKLSKRAQEDADIEDAAADRDAADQSARPSPNSTP